MAKVKTKKKPDVPDEPDYKHRYGENVLLAPPRPLLWECPDCTAEEASAPPYLRRTFTMRFGYSLTEQWGCVVTRHDFYKCRECRETYVSTNGRGPDVAADQYKIGKRN